MPHFMILVIATVSFGDDPASGKNLAEDPFLGAYVEQLKKTTSAKTLSRIKSLSKSDLIVMHHGYGMHIRNQWIYGDRDPALKQFFLDHKIRHPDNMSQIVIEALWLDLNKSLSLEERASVEKTRAMAARRRASYEKLETECEEQLKKARTEIEKAITDYESRWKKPAPRHPIEEFVIDKSGHVKEIHYAKGTPGRLKDNLKKLIDKFTFTAFEDDDFVTVDIDEISFSRVRQRDYLYQ